MTGTYVGASLGGLSPSEREAVRRYLADHLPAASETPRAAELEPYDEAEAQRLYESFKSDDRAAETSQDLIELLEELVSMHRALG